MTAFVVGCAVMLIAALAWITLPLLRAASGDEQRSRAERGTSTLIVAVLVSGLAVAMYAKLSTWNWKAVETASEQAATVDSMLKQLEAKLAANPQDLQGWLLLGRSYVALQRFAPAVDAYQHAYDLTKGENTEALIGLGEAMALLDHWRRAGARVINGADVMAIDASKARQLSLISSLGLAIPATRVVHRELGEDHRSASANWFGGGDAAG